MPTTATTLTQKDFKDWTLEDAQSAVSAAIAEGAGSQQAYTANAAYVEEHDHWQNGSTWAGPNGGSDAEVRARVLASVQRQFTPVDVVGEVLDNLANALLKREALVSFVAVDPADPKSEDEAERTRAEEQAAEAKAMNEAVSRWWDKKLLWALARKATKRSRWAGRGALRVWIAPGALVEGDAEEGEASARVLPSGLAFADALARVELSAPTPDTARVFINPTTQRRAAIFLFETKDGQKAAEIWSVDGTGTDAKTVLRVLSGTGDTTRNEEHSVPIGGRLPIAEMEADLLITEPVRRQQARLNFFESMLVRVGEAAGFPERYTTNAKPNGMWLKSAPTDRPPLEVREIDGETWYLHPQPRTLGASITTELVGIEITDDAGRTTLASPSVTKFDPTDPDYAIRAARHARRTILESCRQGHLAADSTAESSGLAYQQARAKFENDVENTRSPLESMLRTIIETAIALAELMSSKPAGGSFLDRFRCVVTARVSVGPILPDEKRVNSEQAEKGHLSRESAMAANGVEDVPAEIALVDTDERARLALEKTRAETVKSWIDAGAGVAFAAKRAGMSEEEATAFAGSEADNTANNTQVTQ